MQKEKKTHTKYMGTQMLTFVCMVTAVALLWNARLVSIGIRQGLMLCSSIIIPSLFPFMALSGFMATSRVSLILNRCLRPITKYLLRLPESAAAPLLMGFIGGYPVGARTLSMMVRERRISASTAGRMLCFCVNAGPPFLLAAVGSGMLGNIQLGVLLLVAQVGSALVLGVLLGLRAPHEETTAPAPQGFRSYSFCFVQSVGDAASAMLPICAFVTIFSALGSLLMATGLPDRVAHTLCSIVPAFGEDSIKAFLLGILEVTNGCFLAASSGQGGLYVIAALVSLCGVSVLFQVLAAIHGSGIPVRGFLLSRFIHAALTLALFCLLLHIFPQALAVFGSTVMPAQTLSAPMGGSVSLLLMCAVFLIGTRRNALSKFQRISH